MTQRARLTVSVANTSDSTVRAALYDDVTPAGQHLYPWRGTLVGVPAAAGVYEIRVVARSSVTERTDIARQYFRVGYGRDGNGVQMVMLNPVVPEP